MDKPPQRRKASSEKHLVNRMGWLRAAVLGANDGILSTASIVSGVAAGGAPRGAILLAGLAGLVAGAGSMATGEYVSVSSQADIEGADLDREKSELKRNPDYEREELAQIYVTRGLDLPLARQVATRLMEHDALGAHARDELGMFDITKPRPIQAAMASAASFIGGAALPLIVAVLSPPDSLTALVVGSALVSLVLLGGLGAQAGGVPILRPIMRILVWGALSLGLTMLIGEAFGFKS